MLIIEQSEADEETALDVIADDITKQEKPKNVENRHRCLVIPMKTSVKEEEEVKQIHDPMFKKIRQRNHARIVSLLREQHTTEDKAASFVVKYNWKVPQYEYNPRILKYMS